MASQTKIISVKDTFSTSRRCQSTAIVDDFLGSARIGKAVSAAQKIENTSDEMPVLGLKQK